MKQHELFSYAYDYLSQLLDHEEILHSVRGIFFFGSVVRGDFHPQSDVDIFIDTAFSAQVKKIVDKELSLFEKRAEKTWKARGIDLPLKIQVGDIEHPRWRDLHDQIAQYGKVLYGAYKQVPGGLQHYVLISYMLGKLEQKGKVSFLRALFGYSSKKGKKEYRKKGFIEDVGGKKIGINSILVPRDQVRGIRKVLNVYKVPHTVKDVWMNEML